VVCPECDLETSRMRRLRAQWLSSHEKVLPLWEILCSERGPEICIKVGLYFVIFLVSSRQMTGKRSLQELDRFVFTSFAIST
jgi:hypothetical protein